MRRSRARTWGPDASEAPFRQTTPCFPSYPSNHAVFSTARSEMLAYLFPVHADEIRAIGKEGGDSRIWAGIHYQIDLDAGKLVGKSVADKFIAWANADGSQ